MIRRLAVLTISLALLVIGLAGPVAAAEGDPHGDGGENLIGFLDFTPPNVPEGIEDLLILIDESVLDPRQPARRLDFALRQLGELLGGDIPMPGFVPDLQLPET